MAKNTSHHNSLSTATHHMTSSGAKVWCATFATEAVLVATGNLFIITVFVKSRELYRRPQHFFLINLAVADCLVGAFAEPLFVYILGGFYNLWSFKAQTSLGDAVVLLDMFSGISSVAFLTAIALERLYATVRPAIYRSGTKKWLYALLAVALWTLPAAISLFARLMFGNNYDSLYVWMPFVCVLLLLIGLAYFIIWVKLLHFSPKRVQHTRERKLNVTLTILTLTSLSTWLPFIILNTVNMFRPVNLQAVYATKVLHYGNSLVNPFLFSLKMPMFKKAAKKIFCTSKRNSVQNSGFSTKNRRDTSLQGNEKITNLKVTAV